MDPLVIYLKRLGLWVRIQFWNLF